MAERFCRTGDVDLCFESIGDPRDPTVVLVMGLGLTMHGWRDDFCALLAGHGLHVVRFDNRDAGRSTCFPGPGVSAVGFLRRRARPVYTLADMADDTAGLAAHLGGRAHVVGASLGAAIAQEAAIRHPRVFRSLVSIMGRPGDGRTGRVAPSMWPHFLRPAPADPDAAAEHLVRIFRRIGSTGRTAEDDEDARVLARRLAARERDPTGSGRQLAAIIAERDRTGDLAGLDLPALVVHGDRDRIIRPSGGRATAAAIPGAELLMVEGMGHDLPRRVWPTVAAGIARTVAAGEARTVR